MEKISTNVKPCWILCNPRSGSSILCDFLNFTGKFPAFDHPDTKLRRGPLERGLAFNEWFRLYNSTEEFELRPPPFVKSILHQYEELLGRPGRNYIKTLLPGVRFVLLKRKNLANHVLSQYFAEHTQTYHIYNQEQLQRYLNRQLESFAIDKLRAAQEKVSQYNSSWNWFLEDEPRLTVYYEDFIEQPQKVIEEILTFCEIPFEKDDLDKAVEAALVKTPRILKMTRPEAETGLLILKQLEQEDRIQNTMFDTYPLVFHAQGKMHKNPLWEFVSNTYYSPKKDCERLDIITWNSRVRNDFLKQNGKQLGIFEESLGTLRHTVLGQDATQWYNRMKLTSAADYLAGSKFEFTLGADSSDVLLRGEPSEILERFLSMDCDMLFNAELHCWPDSLDPAIKAFEESVASDHAFKYLNGGVWIGKTAFCKEVFERGKKLGQGPGSEQAILKQVYKEFYPRIKLDHRCEIFQTLNSIPNILKSSRQKPVPKRRLLL